MQDDFARLVAARTSLIQLDEEGRAAWARLQDTVPEVTILAEAVARTPVPAPKPKPSSKSSPPSFKSTPMVSTRPFIR
jgi:hypothetical protein